jgi:hypothetical protein
LWDGEGDRGCVLWDGLMLGFLRSGAELSGSSI